MTKLEMFQNALVSSCEKTLAGYNESLALLERIAKLKANAVKYKTLGIEYDCDVLISNSRWNGDSYSAKKGYKFKSVAIKTSIKDYNTRCLFEGSGDENYGLFSLSILFLRDPSPILEKKDLTSTEKDVLKQLAKEYNKDHDYQYYDPEKAFERIHDLNYRLKEMKNKYDVTIELCWNFNFENITDSDFLTSGLRARATLF